MKIRFSLVTHGKFSADFKNRYKNRLKFFGSYKNSKNKNRYKNRYLPQQIFDFYIKNSTNKITKTRII